MFLNQFFSNPVVSLTKPTTLFGSIADRRKSKLLKNHEGYACHIRTLFLSSPGEVKGRQST
nr:MAG TPA: hypothetical protein [Caudoviricetes sp.]